MKLPEPKIKLSIRNILILALIFGMPIVISQGFFLPTKEVSSSYNGQKEFENLYRDNASTPITNPSMYENSTADLVPPTTEIVQILDPNNKSIQHNGNITGDYFMVTFNATDNVAVDYYECAIDSQPFIKCISPIVIYNTDKYNDTKTLEIRAVDTSGNVEQQPVTFLYKEK